MGQPALTEMDREWRYARIRQMLKLRGLDGMLVSGEAVREGHVRYLTGRYYRIGYGMAHVLFPSEGEPTLFAGAPEREYLVKVNRKFAADHWVDDIRVLSVEGIVRALREKGLDRAAIGVTLDTMPAAIYFELVRQLPHAKLVDVAQDFIRLRWVKSDNEVALARESARIVDLCWERIRDNARPGMHEHEIMALAEEVMWASGCDKTFNLSSSGKDITYPIWPSAHSPKVVQKGDLFLAEITACYGGYWTQKIGLYSFGQPEAIHRELFAASKLALEQCERAIRPGIAARDVVSLIDETVTGAGFLSPSGFIAGPHGHLMGLEIDEGTFTAAQDLVLEAGMVVAIHPSAAMRGWDPGQPGLFGPGATFVVRDTGAVRLNETPDEFVLIG